MKYYCSYAFQSEIGFGFGGSDFNAGDKITLYTLDKLQKELFEQNKELFTKEPIIISWQKLEEEDEI